uniref:Enhancer of rudimentary homolog n=1 Tax=Parascaris univalens TaxID=6257 RepID=A0A915APD2_PARUN
MSHTVLLIQTSPLPQSRSWIDYETLDECLDDICEIYELHRSNENVALRSTAYSVSELFEFIDRLADLSCFVWHASSAMYAPHNKQWIKEQIYIFLRDKVHNLSYTDR